MKFKCLIALIVSLLSCLVYSNGQNSELRILHGSAVITAFTKDSIVIAADSKLRHTSKSGNSTISTISTIRKFGNYRNVYFACTGLLGITRANGDAVFDAFAAMTYYLTIHDSL